MRLTGKPSLELPGNVTSCPALKLLASRHHKKGCYESRNLLPWRALAILMGYFYHPIGLRPNTPHR
jgi:hypothetical protein